MTAIPLLFFAAATRRLRLSTVGLLQYLAPVLQFAVGVGIDHEPMPPVRWVGFTLVWIALIVLTVDGIRSQRRRLPAEPVEAEPVSCPVRVYRMIGQAGRMAGCGCS